jgi:hypothetical protein
MIKHYCDECGVEFDGGFRGGDNIETDKYRLHFLVYAKDTDKFRSYELCNPCILRVLRSLPLPASEEPWPDDIRDDRGDGNKPFIWKG